jgi:prephenate dehydrogenase
MVTMDIGIYGLGRFGSFWAECLSEHFSVKGYSRNPRRPTPPGVERVSEEELLSQPVIILCVAISAMEEVAGRIASSLEAGSLVMDTCSVKVFPASVMEKSFPAGVEILATHPMFGPDSAQNGFAGLPMVLCPIRLAQERLSEWENFFRALGLTVFIMSPQEHDREAAYTQGITHYVGRVLADLGLAPSPISTLGYHKLLEIREQTCNDPWQLFLDLQRFNPYTREMRERLHRSLDRILKQLEGSLDNREAGSYHNQP